jgi:exo-beta-1,3-glucanase (GH17 family)/cellulose synthase/poly-beta-1,6-N-acetylglucosamine synthase-like glycosyltransferase
MRIVLTAAVVAAAVHAAAWHLTDRAVAPADLETPIDYVSYSPYLKGEDPRTHRQVIPPEQITADLAAIAGVAQGVRTYSTIDGIDQVPALAAKHGLNVTLGAWIGDTAERDKAEVEEVVQLSKQHRNVRSVLVGNEVLLRGERTPEELITLIQKVKKQVRVPVSTGEIWYEWMQYPKLVNAVDFLAVHILPYWEGVAPEQAVAYTIEKIDLLRKTYPGKRIVITEFGWPSQGYNRLEAEPGRLTQAEIIRDFIAEAERRGVEYNIIEAFDQTWKVNEGSVGAYWGIFDADRNLKFPLTGLVQTYDVAWKAAGGITIGLLLTFAGLFWRRPTFGHALAFAVCANALSFGIAAALAYPFEHYMNFGIWVMWGIGALMLVPLTLITLTKVNELSEVLFGTGPRRLITAKTQRAFAGPAPKVSIHIPAYREPAGMVVETLNSLAALDYPNYEVVVIVNNTPEAHYSAPVAARCRELGDRFKFLDITCTGFKAGALNVALQHTAPDASIIAVLDADYVVEKSWLADLVPHFDDPNIALVQAPQDHRDGDQAPLKQVMNAEYAGFFDIGMVQRNEDDAIITHGTMCLVRRSALNQVGGWGTDTICEDTELGLRLYEAGYQALYTNYRYGRGMLPDTFKAFKTQRFRWAYGAMQIIRKHWTHMLPNARTLTPAQKFHFLSGWSLWFADALGTLASILNLIWVPVIIFVGVVIPAVAFTVPILAAFLVNLLHCILLYGRRVRMPMRHVPGAAIAAMSLQLTVARAVLVGMIQDSLPFRRTEKGGNARRGSENPAFWEALLGAGLLISAVVLLLLNTTNVVEMTVFASTLLIQSVPFLAAAAMVAIERYQGRTSAAKPVANAAGTMALEATTATH